ncbi:MAG: PAS domain S-box protein [Bacteroidetes bacterium]|nr:PAS domain S-box protein [Bacteroidota bacterium]MBU1720872.1 PAS domain S-box protein [Bacteroidota bacterium]
MALLTIHPNGTIESADEEFAAITGYSPKELIGKPYLELHFEDSNQQSQARTLLHDLKAGMYREGIFQLRKKDGQPLFYRGVFKPGKDNYGMVSSIHNLIIDEIKTPELVSGSESVHSQSSTEFQKIIIDRQERLKELACINQTTYIMKEGKPVAETLFQICQILPRAWKYPDATVARVVFDEQAYTTPKFRETEWAQKASFRSIDNKAGSIEIFYLEEFPKEDEGPFLREERHLIDNIAVSVVGFLNSIKAKDILHRAEGRKPMKSVTKDGGKIMNRQLLQRFLNRQNASRDVFHDLMPFKVREILLVANLYDAFNIEREGRFSEHILGEYYQLNLTSMPRVTGVTSYEEAIDELNTKHYDLIIIMMGVDKKTPVVLSGKIKEEFPYIPIFLLLNNNSEISIFREDSAAMQNIDKIFVWNGDSKVFFAMIKFLEDKVNVENDTRKGLVRIILLVEDDARFYSRYLPMLYYIVMEQTKRIIEDVTSDELYKVLRLRARPKILLANNFEEAVEIFMRYKEYLACLITDVRFEKNHQMNNLAGFELVEYIRQYNPELPIVFQSSEEENAQRAYEFKASFINKNSDSLSQDFKSFISYYLGFGNFIYRDKSGREIAVAQTLKEFEAHMRTIPDESLIYHAKRDHFSLWLMARGEVEIAKIIHPAKVNDFKTSEELRSYLADVIKLHQHEQNKGKIVHYEESAILDDSNIVTLASGALGGKGRGVAFITSLINNFDFSQLVPDINIRAPKTMIIGTDEFESFLERNDLFRKIVNIHDYEKIKRLFISARLSDGLTKKLRRILRLLHQPIAIRSSGLFEDSLMQPFAGIFETYILPNNHPDQDIRLQQLVDAIKLVYASIFSNTARGYIEAINYKIEEEKMAVIIQELVGRRSEDYFYPDISGVAQSYNYYPFSHMKPEEGFAMMAVGLGKYVVEGEKAYRFSPKYPATEINSPEDQYKNSQVDFFAVDMAKTDLQLLEGEDAGLTKIDITDAERHGNLKHCASVYEMHSQQIKPGIDNAGPRIVNFANILKYEYIPLAKAIEVVLDVVKEALGSPVEIEFAVDLKKDENYRASFYLLQIKPLIGNAQDYSVDMKAFPKKSIILYAEKSMGNGLVDYIEDVIYVDVNKFDKAKTEEMAVEIERLNQKMKQLGRKYILIGPGRWGTRDRWIGIPVKWPQISNAKVIVETSLEGFPLDASSGSHFFHNVTSMNVGYFSVLPEMSNSYITYDILDKQEVLEEATFFRHVRFAEALKVRMDGKKRIALITNK